MRYELLDLRYSEFIKKNKDKGLDMADLLIRIWNMRHRLGNVADRLTTQNYQLKTYNLTLNTYNSLQPLPYRYQTPSPLH
jgi:hypothetical protein